MSDRSSAYSEGSSSMYSSQDEEEDYSRNGGGDDAPEEYNNPQDEFYEDEDGSEWSSSAASPPRRQEEEDDEDSYQSPSARHRTPPRRQNSDDAPSVSTQEEESSSLPVPPPQQSPPNKEYSPSPVRPSYSNASSSSQGTNHGPPTSPGAGNHEQGQVSSTVSPPIVVSPFREAPPMIASSSVESSFDDDDFSSDQESSTPPQAREIQDMPPLSESEIASKRPHLVDQQKEQQRKEPKNGNGKTKSPDPPPSPIKSSKTKEEAKQKPSSPKKQPPPIKKEKGNAEKPSPAKLRQSATAIASKRPPVSAAPPRATSMPATMLSKSSRHSRASNASAATMSSGPPVIKLSWKADPEASYSDWTVVVPRRGGSDDVYRLHRNMLGYGSRRSDYFIKEFRNQSLNAKRSPMESILELDDAKADIFPMVLDFMYYTREVKQTLSADRACTVFSLAEYLEIPALQKAIAEFYRKNINANNMEEFLTAASAASRKLLLVAKAKVGSILTERPELAGLIAPHFLASILEMSQQHMEELHGREPKKYTQEWMEAQSRHWSKAASICAVQNNAAMTDSLFERLFHEDVLPVIHPSVALKIMALDEEFQKKNGVAPGANETSASLRARCIASISENWEDFEKGFESSNAASEVLKNLPSNVLADILVQSMSQRRPSASSMTKPPKKPATKVMNGNKGSRRSISKK